MVSNNEEKRRCFPTIQKRVRAHLSTKAHFSHIWLIIVFLLLITPVYAMRDPSAVYCSAQGYEYTIEKTPEGDWGYCILPNGTKVDSWLFLQGKTAISNNYCSKQGLETKTISDRLICIQFMTDECAVCILANGTEVEVTELMGLSFNESVCGDGTCGMPENHQTCPQDCPSGAIDEYCDGVSDTICDPDCNAGEDADCASDENVDNRNDDFIPPFSLNLVVGILLAIVVMVVVLIIWLRRRT